MKKWRNVISLIVLHAFLVAILPRTFFHSCKAEHHHPLSKSEKVIAGDDCDFCDFELSAFTLGVDIPFRFQVIPYEDNDETVFLLHDDRKLNQPPLRGPPSC